MHYENQFDELSKLLGSYVTGQLDPGAHALVAAHLEVSQANRNWVSALEAAGGHFLDSQPVDRISSGFANFDMVNGILSQPRDKIVSSGHKALGERNEKVLGIDSSALPPRHSGSATLPPTLRRMFGFEDDRINWRSRLAGLKECKAAPQYGDARLLWIDRGRAMPQHTHDGLELTLVLQGSFYDGIGHFKRGDISIADDSVEHRPVAGTEDDCICFAVTHGSVRLSGVLGRLLSPIIKY